ncbi:PP2C family serine/threonine-protein phosphatase [Massilia sp. TS11]|uniref:PP2C family protein-serine/threonine phosphatase n=1 Tax=Massilia sp. TS11 TaxID=2908003 RepID=UPI001EDA0286|nr:PP2C family serine/threonine-protein phosphatase [Massilia sp. TS11]MCG2583118.1 serine/threonine-protein phosphatase [Massilia sp. TS11]
MNAYKIEAGTAQHLGSRAQQNDRAALFLGARAPGFVLAVLADGFTGHASAAEQVLQTAKQVFDQFKPGDHPSIARLEELLREIVHEAHLIIKLNGVSSQTEQHSTVVLLVLTPHGEAVWAHVGESRLYRFQQGQPAERSQDSAYVAHLIAAENIPPEAAKQYRASKLLTNAIGRQDKEPFVICGAHQPLAAGDCFLLASDGLWRYFTDAELAAVTSKSTPRQAADLLIPKAQERAKGQGDNCTMAIIKLIEPPKEAPSYTVQKLGKAV